MKAIIRLTDPSRSREVVKGLISTINGDMALSKQIFDSGVLFSGLQPTAVKTLTEQLAQYKYSAYQATEDSVHLNGDDNTAEGLDSILFRVLGQQTDLAKMLWASGLTIETATADQAKVLKKDLEFEGADVTLIEQTSDDFTVSGQVRRTDNAPFGDSSYTVRAFDQLAVNKAVPLGGPVFLRANGTYHISYAWESTDGRNGPNLLVRLYNSEGEAVAENDTPYASRQETLNLKVDLPEETRFVVNGTVRSEHGSALRGLVVRAFDRDMRHEEPLGQAVTDAQGFYEISYTPSQFRRAEKESADLLIRVSGANNTEVAVSDTVFNAEPVQTLDLTVDDLAQSEFERYVEELTPLIGKVSLAELTDTDVLFLVGETGIAEEHLRFLQLDAEWSDQHDVDSAVFYGLFRQQLSTRYRSLLAEKPSRFRETLKKAVAERIVPAALGDDLDSILERLQELAVEDVFEPDDEAAVPPLGLLLGTAPGLTEKQQRRFVRFTLQYEHNGADDFWERAGKELGDDAAVRAVQLNLQSSALTFNHPPVLRQVQAELQEPSVRALAGWSEEDWLAVVKRAAAHGDPVPSGYDSAEDYVDAVVKNIDTHLPSERLFARAQRTADDLPVEAGSPLFNLYAHLGLSDAFNSSDLSVPAKEKRIRQKIQQFDSFQQNNPALDLRYADLLRGQFYVQGQLVDIDWGAIALEEQPGMLKQARAFQRVMAVSPDTETGLGLLAAGYGSSYEIAGTSLRKLADDVGQYSEHTEKALAEARQQLIRTELLRSGIEEVVYGIHPAVDNSDPAAPEAFLDQSDLAALFGSQSFCDCPHCNSVLSQSAYFVDLMAFVDEHVSRNRDAFGLEGDDRRKSVLYLPKRRPDLWDLPLSCENIHSQIPYLQVVNHIFEGYLIGHLGVGDRDGLYQELAKVRSTFSQPFLPARDELRIYLSHFRLTHADIYGVLGRPAPEHRLAYLQVAPVEFDIVSQAVSDGAKVRRLYGLGVRGPVKLPIPQFMNVTGLDRKGVTQLLAAASLEGHKLRVDRKTVAESLGQQYTETLESADATRGVADLDLVHRWIRLWRKTGWTLAEFDFVLGRLRDAELAAIVDERAVHRMADLRILQDRLKLSVEELVCFVGLVPDPAPGTIFFEEKGSLYHRLFGEEPFVGESVVFHDFETEQPTVELPYPDAYRLLSGLSLKESELIELLVQLRYDLGTIEGTEDDVRTMALNAETISLLYRHGLLARKLRRSPSELFTLVRLALGTDRPALNSLGDLLELTAVVAEIEDLPFSPAELGWLVLAEGGGTRRRQMTDEQFDKFRMELPAMDADALCFTLGNIYGWKRGPSEDEASEEPRLLPQAGVVMALAGVTLETLQEAALTASDEALRGLVEKLENWHLMGDTLDLKVEHQRFIRDSSSIFGDPAVPSLALIRHLVIYRSIVSPEHVEMAAAHAMLLAFGADAADQIARILDCEPSLIATLLPQVMTLSENTLDAVAQVRRAVAICQEIGLNGAALEQIAASDDATDDDAFYAMLQQGRDAMLGAFLAKYPDEAQRQGVLEPYADALLELRRDGLVDFLLSPAFTDTKPDIQLRDTLDLYRFFLMDPEMEGCGRTSWVLAGISSLQLYVHRCLMNLEQNEPTEGHPRVHVPPSAIPGEEWAWRKNYRVWEANRKVFLYPENYLFADLRDDKTPFFEEAVDELQQQEITDESAESAYKNYFDKFSTIANMKYAGASYHRFGGGPLYLFAHTLQDPPQYHYRTVAQVSGSKLGLWSPWHRVDLAINAPVVSPVRHKGKLYLFWVSIQSRLVNEIVNGTSIFRGYHHSADLNFSHQSSTKQWQPLTKIRLKDAFEEVDKETVEVADSRSASVDGTVSVSVTRPIADARHNDYLILSEAAVYTSRIRFGEKNAHTLKGYRWDRIYPRTSESGIHFYYSDTVGLDGQIERASYYKISLYQKQIETVPILGMPRYWLNTMGAEGGRIRGGGELSKETTIAVNNSEYDFITSFDSDSFLLTPFVGSYAFAARRLGTTVAEGLGELLHQQGLDAVLSATVQFQHVETSEPWTSSERVHFQPETRHIDFAGACGNYFQELYFHLPFLIADHLNANQKFAEARRWYHFIFDPTASENPHIDEQPEDRNWRYTPFRDNDIPTLQAMLTDPVAIEQYETDPFNPWAIARLRPSALQKAVVMKYIDNLLDWGDHLFTQDTYESINEATLLYMTALDILGDRPADLGTCSVPESITYDGVKSKLGDESDFVVLENLIPTLKPELARMISFEKNSYDGTGRVDLGYFDWPSSAGKKGGAVKYGPTENTPIFRSSAKDVEFRTSGSSITGTKSTGRFLADMSRVRPVFCVPVNENLLGYWDRVEDRLFKIRNCMNISGMRRALALYEPPIDPMLLVRAKAAGLTLEDVLHPTPERGLYRFAALIEKARGVTATVQGFGSALLSALEKKDAEELTLMRVTHERNILKLTRQLKEKQIQESQRQRLSLEASETNVRSRIEHYTNLVETGLSSGERQQQEALESVRKNTIAASVHQIVASLSHLVPEFGSPFSLKFGGKQIADSVSAFAGNYSALASAKAAISSAAGLEASNQRRAEEWVFQLQAAELELGQTTQQIEAAKIREEIAVRDLEIYEKSVEQSEEQYDFIRGKFTKLGLYSWMAQRLTRLYRQAYLLAYDVAKQAEKAYQFERGDDSAIFIEAAHWEQDKAGLLAGEHLMLQLQQLDQAFLTTNAREHELTKHISLAMLNPEELIRLRETGSCDIDIPVVLFDLDFPGQYRRRIKSVSLTIPCVTGPYTNVSAKLTLTENQIRADLVDAPTVSNGPFGSIATSTAQSDGGMFELNFRDERYLPFEGAGAVSKWHLELSGKWQLDIDDDGEADVVDLSQFNFDTISDVIVHISYTAKDAQDGGAFKRSVIHGLQEAINTWLDDELSRSDTPLTRLISLRQEFASEFHRFLHPEADDSAHETRLTIEDRHFPHFLRDYFRKEAVTALEAHVLIKAKVDEHNNYFASQGVQLGKGTPPSEELPSDRLTVGSNWGGLPTATFTVTGPPTGEWTLQMDPESLPPEITVVIDGRTRLNPDVVDDIFLVLRYGVGRAMH